MNENYRFNSILAPYIAGLLDEKRSLGFSYITEELTLTRFDQYCIHNNLDSINVTKEFLDGWCTKTNK